MKLRVAVALTLLGVSLAITAGAQAKPAEGVATGPTDTLRLAFTTNNTSTQLAYIATARRFFARRGLAVKISDGNGSNVASMLVSGQTDIGFFNLATPLLTAKQGKATSIIYGLAGGGISNALVGAPGRTDTIAKLKALDKCRIAAFPPGSASYPAVAIYNRALGMNCEAVPLSQAPAQLGALQAGRVDAVIGNLTSFSSAVVEGRAVALVDPSNPVQRRQFFGPADLELLFYGMTDNLRSKRRAVTKFIGGLEEARKYLKNNTDAQVARVLRVFEPFKARSVTDIARDVKYVRGFSLLGTTNGYITRGQWTKALVGAEKWGLTNFTSTDPDFAYARRVDMSYYNASVGKPRGG